MHLTVLAASGATGRELTRQALARGHSVTGLLRDPGSLPEADGLTRIAVDVHDRASVARAVGPGSIVVSGLGVAKGGPPQTLAHGARAVVEAGAARVVWLGAYDTGRSAQSAGLLTRTLLRALGDEVADKVAADDAILAAHGTVFPPGR